MRFLSGIFDTQFTLQFQKFPGFFFFLNLPRFPRMKLNLQYEFLSEQNTTHNILNVVPKISSLIRKCTTMSKTSNNFLYINSGFFKCINSFGYTQNLGTNMARKAKMLVTKGTNWFVEMFSEIACKASLDRTNNTATRTKFHFQNILRNF